VRPNVERAKSSTRAARARSSITPSDDPAASEAAASAAARELASSFLILSA
jgi:hypothetical protein